MQGSKGIPDIFESADHFISRKFSKDDAILRSINLSLAKAGIKNISVSSSQGKFLHLLVLMCRARRVLEISTLAGYSTIWMARALPKNGRLISIESNPEHARITTRHISRAGLSDQVEIKLGVAVEILAFLSRRRKDLFDMVFIDADRPSLREYFTWALKLTHSVSLIVADNVIRQGKVMNPDARDPDTKSVQRFLRSLASSEKVSATVLQTVGPKGHDGMSIAVVHGKRNHA